MPALVLGFGVERLGAGPALAIALAFPLVWGAYAILQGGGFALAALGFVTTLATGGINLFELDVRWFAWKEAAVPVTLGSIAVATAPTRFAAVPVLLDRILDPAKVGAALDAAGRAAEWRNTMRIATVAIGASLWLSAAGSFALARYLVASPAGSDAFASEVGRFTAWSFPAVGLPSLMLSALILWRTLLRLESCAGVPVDELVRPGVA